MCAIMVSETRSVYIDAAPEEVWAVLADVERWPEWAGSMRNLEREDEGEFGLGSRARLEITGVPSSIWQVTEFTPGRSFTWESKARGVASLADHRIDPDGGGTKLTLRTESSGLMATIFAPLIRRVARRNLQAEADGLKQRCESAAAEAESNSG